jgi:hypothetical protein
MNCLFIMKILSVPVEQRSIIYAEEISLCIKWLSSKGRAVYIDRFSNINVCYGFLEIDAIGWKESIHEIRDKT